MRRGREGGGGRVRAKPWWVNTTLLYLQDEKTEAEREREVSFRLSLAPFVFS